MGFIKLIQCKQQCLVPLITQVALPVVFGAKTFPFHHLGLPWLLCWLETQMTVSDKKEKEGNVLTWGSVLEQSRIIAKPHNEWSGVGVGRGRVREENGEGKLQRLRKWQQTLPTCIIPCFMVNFTLLVASKNARQWDVRAWSSTIEISGILATPLESRFSTFIFKDASQGFNALAVDLTGLVKTHWINHRLLSFRLLYFTRSRRVAGVDGRVFPVNTV